MTRRRKSRERLAWGLAALAGLVALTALGLGAWVWSGRTEPRLTTLSIAVSQESSASGPAVSRDGRQVAYGLWRRGEGRLYVRSLDRLEPRLVPGAENVVRPFFSPDGRWIAYYDTEADELRKIPTDGGSPFTICTAESFNVGDWGEDGTIVFSMGAPSGLWTVPAAGGSARPLTGVDRVTSRDDEEPEESHFYPWILPGGEAALFSTWAPNVEERIGVVDLSSGETRFLFPGYQASYSASSGHLLYRRRRDRALVAVPFDVDRLEVTGDPTVVASDVTFVAISHEGTLVYEALREQPQRLVWLSPDGSREPLPVPEREYEDVEISPDGRRAAVTIEEIGEDDEIWVLELEHGTSTRITTYPGDDSDPIWSPDGRFLVFSSNRDGPPNLYRAPADGGEPERLTEAMAIQRPTQVSPDGRSVVFRQTDLGTGKRDSDLHLLDLESGEVTALLATPADEWWADISPDGRWIVYGSDESGRNQIYLRSFPDLTQKRLVSLTGSGGGGGWDATGRRIYFGQRSEEGLPQLWAVDFTPGPPPGLGQPRPIFTVSLPVEAVDLAPDGQRMLLAEPTGPTEREIVVVVGWGQSMKETR